MSTQRSGDFEEEQIRFLRMVFLVYAVAVPKRAAYQEDRERM